MMKYKDSRIPTYDRVEDLLSLMTLEEKVAQLSCILPSMLIGNTLPDEKLMKKYLSSGLGRMTQFSSIFINSPVEIAQTSNNIQSWIEKNTRLSIPVLFQNETLNGLLAIDATIFPSPLNMASTWDYELIEEAAAIIRKEMRALGLHKALAPVLDIGQDPRWGRINETYGEDPYLCASMGSAYVKGLQTENIKNGVAACAKHFLAYSRSQGGLNVAEVSLSFRDIYEYFAFPFEACIQENDLKSIMVTYSSVGGIPISIHKELLRDLLRERMKFDGNLLCDGGSIEMCVNHHYVCSTMKEAGIKALQAGLDADTPVTEAYSYIPDAVSAGDLKIEFVDEAVRRVLKLKFEMGLFENRYVDEKKVNEVFYSQKDMHLEVADRISEQSIILLKNENNILPLKEINSVAVIGPHANSLRTYFGAYTMPASIEMYQQIFKTSRLGQESKATMAGVTQAEEKQIEARDDDMLGFAKFFETAFSNLDSPADLERIIAQHYSPQTLLAAIKEHAHDGISIRYAKGCSVSSDDCDYFDEAFEIASQSDVVIAALGDKSGWVDGTAGEGHDRSSLELPGVQQELLRSLKDIGKPLILVLFSARPYAIEWPSENVDAILNVWFPGERGGIAIAKALFGKINPSGKLPITIPRSVGQVPIFYNHRIGSGYWHPFEETIQHRSEPFGGYVNEPATPLYPFGFGLSYTQFDFSNLKISTQNLARNNKVEISCEIENIGEYPGIEIAQLYTFDREASISRPVKKLAGFCRVSLNSGEKRKITFCLDISQLAFLNEDNVLVVEPGNIDLMIGPNSSDICLKGHFSIPGKVEEIVQGRKYFTKVIIDNE